MGLLAASVIQAGRLILIPWSLCPDRHAKMLRRIPSRPFAGSANYAPMAIAIALRVAG
jgi:hypothetical protein